ncbi:MAG: flagellar hook-basal body complex protein, partial [Planctomycetota bacterium]|nr:flagellar hook-basal body complex protein [Planctomycetota bacterium]
MAASLFTALSGMTANQQWIDVIGNNLANSNTPGYKVTRATFASTFAQTLRFPSAPNGNLGGTNPTQIGLGVTLAGTDRTFSQGGLTNTGRIFDIAIEGKGFFALSNGSQRYYTRVGTFGLDAERNLVDQRTGMRVLDPTGSSVNVDTEALFPPQATASLELKGNLPAVVTGPLAEVLTGTTGLEMGTAPALQSTGTGPFAVTPGATYTLEVAVSGGAPKLVTVPDADNDGFLTTGEIVAALDALDDVHASDVGGQVFLETDRTGEAVSLKINAGAPNDLASVMNMPTTQVNGTQDVNFLADINTLPSNVVDYVNGDQIDIQGVDTDGSPVSGTFTYGVDGTTIEDLQQHIDNLYTDAEVTLNTSGQLVVTAQTPGEADLLLTISDSGSATGNTNWTDYAVSVTSEGTAPDSVVTSTEVYDNAGVAHTVTLTFERQANSTWNVIASVPEEEGTVLQGGEDSPITGLIFDQDGAPQGLGSVDSTVSVSFTGQPGAQSLSLDLGTDGEFTGLTQFGSQTSTYISYQDGYGDGELANVNVNADGTIDGFYTNGQTRALGSIGIATFANEEGLFFEGDNLFLEAANS